MCVCVARPALAPRIIGNRRLQLQRISSTDRPDSRERERGRERDKRQLRDTSRESKSIVTDDGKTIGLRERLAWNAARTADDNYEEVGGLRYRKNRWGTAAVCVTVPHRALTAPRRVASLKSRLAPHLADRGRRRLAVAAGYSGNWHSERAFGKFPPIYRSVHRPNPHGVRTGASRGDESGILRTNRAGGNLERVERHPARLQKKISGLPRSPPAKDTSAAVG